MKVEARILDHESTVQGERVAMTLDADATAHLMSVLTDLYSDPTLAVVREYSTNALDAHAVAGVTRPIEVTTPTPLAPFFRVRDFGEGLDADDIRNVFSRYGTSTKRDSNDVVGMLGLGCKSALTYADQFTIVATKRGRTVQVLVSRDEDGAGSMTIVSDEATDAESGVEIVVPTKRGDNFGTTCREFFGYWREGAVLVNGEAPARIGSDDGDLWLSPTILLSSDADADTVVMGNVPYPMLDDAEFRPPWRGNYANRRHLVAFVDIGEVTFTPSRETLQATRTTKATLARVRAEAVAMLEASCAASVAAATSPAEAIALAKTARDIGAKSPLLYNGRSVPSNLDRTPTKTNPDGTHTRADTYAERTPANSFLIRSGRYRKVNGEREFTLPLADAETRVFFEGYSSLELTPTKREKIAQYFADNSLDVSRVQVFAERYTADEKYWLAGATFIAWSDVDAIKLARATSADGTRRIRGSYDAAVFGAYAATISADDIDTTKPLYYVNGNRYTLGSIEATRYGIIDASTCTIVALPANRVDKFCRDFPTAKQIDKAATEIARAEVAKLAPAALEAYAFQRSGAGSNVLRALDASRIADPKLADAVRAAKRDTSNVAEAVRKYSRFLPYGTFDGNGTKHGDALAPYPLAVNAHGKLAVEHVYDYTSTVYAKSLTSGDNPSPATADASR